MVVTIYEAMEGKTTLSLDNKVLRESSRLVCW